LNFPLKSFIYGGYFGMLECESYSTENFVEDLIDELDASEESLDIDQINMKMLHNALLHGITPEQYTNELKLLVE